MEVNFSAIPKLKKSVNSIGFKYKEEMVSPLGMHLVKYDSTFSLFLPLQPTYSIEETVAHSKCMSCDCFKYHKTTWMCKHV